MQHLKGCLNPRVLVAFIALALAVWAVAPQCFGAILPLVVAAACPVSMVVMMLAMRGMSRPAAGSAQAEDRVADTQLDAGPGRR